MMKTKAVKVVLGIAALSCAPFAAMGNSALYPTEKVTEFVIEKLDLTSLPAPFQPYKEKGKKTFVDYGFALQNLEESSAVLETAGGAAKVSLKVLDQKSSGIFVCVADSDQPDAVKTQRVFLVKRKSSDALLKGRESFREFASCPAIGEDESASEYSGG